MERRPNETLVAFFCSVLFRPVPKGAFDFSGTRAGAPRINPSVLMSSLVAQYLPVDPGNCGPPPLETTNLIWVYPR
jgi:hypothetical protein